MNSEEAQEQETRELVALATAGESGAKEELLGRHLSGLRAFVRLRMGASLRARESTSDLVQSVCREVLEDLDGFSYRNAAGFKSWLYTVALNKLRERGRFHGAARRDRQREEGRVDGELLTDYGSVCTPSHVAMAREEVARVEAAFDELPDDEREVILLSRLVGLTHAEIAERMGRTELACRSLLSRALVRLSKQLGEA